MKRLGIYLAAGTFFLASLLPGIAGAVDKRKVPAIVNIINAEVGKPYSDNLIPDFVRRLAGNGVDVSVSIIPSPKGLSISHEDGLVYDLRKLSDEYPDAVEVGVNGYQFTENEFLGDVYGQARNASEAQSRFTEAFNAAKDPVQQNILLANTMNVPYHAYDNNTIKAVRQAGIKVLMSDPAPNKNFLKVEPKELKKGYRKNPNGVTEIFLDEASSIVKSYEPIMLKDAEELRKGITNQLKSADNPIVITIPMSTVWNELGEERITGYLDSIADLFLDMRGEVDYMLPREFYKDHHEGPGRYILLRIDDERVNILGEEDRREIIKEITDKGLKVTNAVIPLGYGDKYYKPLKDDDKTLAYLNSNLEKMEVAIHGYKHLNDELLGLGLEGNLNVLKAGLSEFKGLEAKVMTLVPPYNSSDEGTTEAMGILGMRILSADHRDRYLFGLDRFGVYHISNVMNMESRWTGDCEYYAPEKMMQLFGRYDDVVLMIHPQTMKGGNKEKFFNLMELLKKDKDISLVNLSEFYDKVFPDIPSLRHIQTSRTYGRDVMTQVPQEKLIDDAKIAWDYFVTSEIKKTGLNAGSIIKSGFFTSMDRHLTLWDMGSLIFANLASRELGLQDNAGFDARIDKALSFLERCPLTKGGLPFANYKTDTIQQTPSESFDSVDLGRLLISMKALSIHHPEYEGRLKGIADRFNIDSIIKDGEIHGMRRGKIVKEHYYNYANYSAKGFLLWGFPVVQYQVPITDIDSARPYLLHIKSRGAISTEPLTTERIELGDSVYANTLCEVMYGAQIERTDKTKNLTSVSEGNIDRSPWFMFQKYVIDAEDEWLSSSKTSEDKPGLHFFSTKAAFMWNVLRDDTYARRLYDKTKGQYLVGWVSGIYEDGKAMKVSDLNTNAMILESVWYKVRGKPLLEK